MFIEILKHTPVWVWVLLAALITLGYFQSRPHAVSERRVVIFPGVYLVLSLLGVWSAFGGNIVGFVAWASGLAIAVLIGRSLKMQPGVRYDPQARKFLMPGSWMPMVLIMAIFLVKFAVGVTTAIAPALAATALYAVVVSAIYGLLSGTFFARSLRTRRAARPGGEPSAPTMAVGPLAN